MSAPSAATPVPAPSVRIRSIPASAGLRWIRLALRAFVRQPGGFMGMFGLFLLAMLLLSIPLALLVPLAQAIHLDTFVVSMLGLVLMPLLSLSFMLATEAVTGDLRIRPGLFFAPLRASAPQRRALVEVGLAYVAMSLAAWYVGNGLDGGETARWFTDRMMMPPEGAAAPQALVPLSDSARLVVFLKVAVVALGSIPLWHAPALIHWGRYGAAKAMFASVVAMWRTRAALAVFALGWFALSFALTCALALLELLLGNSVVLLAVAVMLSWAISALFYVTLWFGFVDTFEITSTTAFRTVMANGEPPAP
jgi:hypothetical protein